MVEYPDSITEMKRNSSVEVTFKGDPVSVKEVKGKMALISFLETDELMMVALDELKVENPPQ
ncbi:MAG: small, acid-soluble spore protein, H family [Solirubrobacterales bacterium]